MWGDEGQSAPVALIFLLVVGFIWQATFYDQGLPSFEPNGTVEEPSNQSGTFDFFDPLIAVVEAVWSGIVLFLNLLVFNVTGAPVEIKWGWRVLVTGGVLWNVIALLRGS